MFSEDTQPVIDPTEALPSVNKMLYDLAWKARNSRFPFEEAISEAYWAFVQACYSYDPHRGAKFTTWCYFKTWTHLKTVVTKKTRDPLVFTEMKEELVGAAPANKRDFLDMVEDLSSDAREIISLLLDAPKEVLHTVPTTTAQLLSRVCDHLGFNRGWDGFQSGVTLHEIQTRFAEINN